MRAAPAARDRAQEHSPASPRIGPLAAAGLFVAGLLAMLGIVLMVNPTRFGTTGAFVGVALLALGSTWTLIAFRGRGRRDGL